MRRLPGAPAAGPRWQAGVVSILFTVVMLLLVSAGLATALRLSDAGLQDAVTSDEQMAALFLAESGVERAHALQAKAFALGTYAASCAALSGTGPFDLGRGRFSYTSATYSPTSCAAGGGGATVGECCSLTVAAEAGASRRVVQAQLETADPNGVAGRSSTTTFLSLKTTSPNSAVLTNLAYRAKDTTGGSNATVEECANLGGNSLTGCTPRWNLESNGTYSVNGMGVSALIPAANSSYSIQTRFKTSSGPAVRQYVLTGALLSPRNPSVPVTLGSSYSQGSTGAQVNRTVGTSSKTITIPSSWCLTSATKASEADAIVYGYSSMAGVFAGAQPGALSEVTLGNASTTQASFSRLLMMRGLRDSTLKGGYDYYLYSQLWTLHNPAYTMDTSITALSSGTLVTLSAVPSVTIRKGTVVAVPGIPDAFQPRRSQRVRVTETALLVPAGEPLPAVGDAVFGPHVVSGTLVSGAGVSQPDGSIRVPVTPAQKASTEQKDVYFRAAVLADSSTQQFSLSSPPSTALAGAKLCGGMCALFQPLAAPNNDLFLKLVDATTGDDWSTGLACFSGVSPQGIEVISGPPLRRVSWNESVQ